MALKNKFYSEIFTNEQKWIDLIDEKLLNSIYCNLVLKPFYEQKKEELQKEYNLTQNKIIGQIIIIIENIINQINLFNDQYNKSQQINLESLLPLFLTNQMNNTNCMENSVFNKNEKKENDINRNAAINEYDYTYEDFPEEIRRIK